MLKIAPAALLLFFIPFMACDGDSGGDSDDDVQPGPNGNDDDQGDDDSEQVVDDDDADDSGDDDADDDVDDDADDDVDDDADDDEIPPPAPNPNARADAFRLFYRERVERVALSLNRFGMAGDAVFATVFGKNYIAKSGDQYEVIPGPNDNNPIGISTYAAWKLYQALGGRTLELTLIRLFEGLVFNERVSGHSGLTCREALPGWSRVMDGQNWSVSRSRFGVPVTSPVVYDPDLEREILETFYNGVVFTYRENPEEYYFRFKPINELTQFAVTFVFDELPRYLRISNCCSSWMISQWGLWEGAFWGNHNSRDNFTDYAMGYLAAFEAEAAPGLPADLSLAAQNAADAARRTGDAIVAAGNIQMTVDEHHDYDVLVPGGEVRPDGSVEWQDLGSLASCQMVYVALAISSEGLSYPVPETPLPGAMETTALKELFRILGLDLPVPVMNCHGIDDAFFGLGWGDILGLEVLGLPIFDLAAILGEIYPDLFFDLFGGAMDDFKELELGVVALCYYARITGDDALYDQSRRALKNLIDFQRILADLVYGLVADRDLSARIVAVFGEEAVADRLRDADEMLYMAALYARIFDMDSPLDDLRNFDRGHEKSTWIESQLTRGDTSPEPLLSDEEIRERILNNLAGQPSWIQERYENRFGDTVPVRRAGEGYERIGPDDEWGPAENPHHFWFGGIELWREAHLCTIEGHTLDCSWARLGCAPADLDDNGVVDQEDQDLFDAAWAVHGPGAECSESNGWCAGADLDGNGVLDEDDGAYMTAARGCTV